MKQKIPRLLFSVTLSVLLSWAHAGVAQVEYMTPAQQKKEVRRALREAKKVKSDYSESHLKVEAYNFQRGESGRKRVKNPQERDEMVMNEDGTPVTKPKSKPKKKDRKSKADKQ